MSEDLTPDEIKKTNFEEEYTKFQELKMEIVDIFLDSYEKIKSKIKNLPDIGLININEIQKIITDLEADLQLYNEPQIKELVSKLKVAILYKNGFSALVSQELNQDISKNHIDDLNLQKREIISILVKLFNSEEYRTLLHSSINVLSRFHILKMNMLIGVDEAGLNNLSTNNLSLYFKLIKEIYLSYLEPFDSQSLRQDQKGFILDFLKFILKNLYKLIEINYKIKINAEKNNVFKLQIWSACQIFLFLNKLTN